METSAFQGQIKARLIQEFSPVFIEVTDDSARHAGHSGAKPGGNTHYRVKMASQCFTGLPLIKRHQTVYRAMEPFFKEGLHALQLELLTPEEWHERSPR